MFDSIPSVITCYLVQRIGYKRYLMWFRFKTRSTNFAPVQLPSMLNSVLITFLSALHLHTLYAFHRGGDEQLFHQLQIIGYRLLLFYHIGIISAATVAQRGNLINIYRKLCRIVHAANVVAKIKQGLGSPPNKYCFICTASFLRICCVENGKLKCATQEVMPQEIMPAPKKTSCIIAV